VSVRDVHELSVGCILIFRKRLTKNVGRGNRLIQNGADAHFRDSLAQALSALREKPRSIVER
jgi:hypothetical protein